MSVKKRHISYNNSGDRAMHSTRSPQRYLIGEAFYMLYYDALPASEIVADKPAADCAAAPA